MDIKELLDKLHSLKLPDGEYAVFGSAVMAVRGMREAPNIDVIVTNKLWKDLLTIHTPDEEGFVRIGQVKISNWWFAPTKKPLSQLISEAEIIEDTPFVRLQEVLDYKVGLNRDKDKQDVKLIREFTDNPGGLGIETYQRVIGLFRSKVDRVLGDEVLALVLFGSVCRHQAKPDSDLDIFVFYDGDRNEINKKLTQIIIEMRKEPEYKDLAKQEIFPEFYPFLISKQKADNLLWVFLDATDHGIVLKDTVNFAANLIEKVKQSGARRAVLPNGKWVWTNL